MSTIITSASNPTVRYLRKLTTSSKFRREEGKYIAHGAHLVRSCLDAGVVPESYILASSAFDKHEISALVAELQKLSSTPYELADNIYQPISDIHAAVGISIVFAAPVATPYSTLSRDALLLDNIQDPGNLGTMLRTAASAGIKEVYLSAGTSSAWSPKALRAGMGAQFAVTIHEQVDLAALIQSSTIPVYATLLARDSVNLYELDLSTPAAWLIGNEGQGVSPHLIALTTNRITIPQADTPVESLNVAAATAVCLYEQYRQRR